MSDKHLKIIFHTYGPRKQKKCSGNRSCVIKLQFPSAISGKKRRKKKKSPYKLHNRKALATLDCAARRAFSPLQSRDATHTSAHETHTCSAVMVNQSSQALCKNSNTARHVHSCSVWLPVNSKRLQKTPCIRIIRTIRDGKTPQTDSDRQGTQIYCGLQLKQEKPEGLKGRVWHK